MKDDQTASSQEQDSLSSEQSVDKSEETPIDKKQQKCLRLVANIQYTEYEVVKEVLKKKFNCKLTKNEDSDIIWVDTGVNSAMVSKLKPYQKVNHYHGMYCLARKNHLGRNLMRLRRAMPNEYNYFPPTWLLPTDWNEFKAHFVTSNETYILKPEALSQGQGIFLINSLEEINLEEKHVIQKYISRPYLIEGLKFDLRIYVLVYGCDPLRIFLFKEGLVRLATEPYTLPNTNNITDLYIHLTNYAINKNNSNFIFNTDPTRTDIGHKRSLSFMWKYIDEHGGDSNKLKEEIKDCIIKTLCAVQPLLKHSYRSCQPLDDHNNKCFEILGFDILLDEDLKPWLLEVNHSPSFTADTPFDYNIKTELIIDALNIVRLDPKEKANYYKEAEEKRAKTVIKERTQKMTREEIAELRKKIMKERDEYELAHCGGFTRIYPEVKEGESKYDKYIIAAQSVWDNFTGSRKPIEPLKVKPSIVPKQMKTQKRGVSAYKNKYPVPANRKPLYYIKGNIPIKQKGVFSIDHSITEVLQDEFIRKRVIERLTGECSVEIDEVVENIVEKLKEDYKNPLEVIEQGFMRTNEFVDRANLKKKLLGPGNYVVPKMIEFNFITNEPSIIQKKVGEIPRKKKY